MSPPYGVCDGFGFFEDDMTVCRPQQEMDDGIYKWVVKGAEGVCGKAVQVTQEGIPSDFCVNKLDHIYHSDFLI